MGTSEFVVAGLLPEIADDFGVSTAGAGLSITVFAVGMIIGAPGMALLTLRVPQRWTLTLALLVFAVGHLAVALTSSFMVLLFARFISALVTGAFWAVAAVVGARIAPPGRSSQALGVVLGGGMLANVLGVPVGAFGGQATGWRGPFWALAVLALVLALVMARVRLDQPAQLPVSVLPPPRVSVRAELSALRSVRIWLALAVCACVNAGVLGLYSFISPLLTDQVALTPSAVPVALLLFGLAASIGSVLGGRAGDRRPLRTPAVTATVSLLACAGIWAASAATSPATSSGLSAATSSTVLVLVFFTVLGLTGFSANPVLIGLIVRFGQPASVLPSAMATAVFNVGTAAGTAVIGSVLSSGRGIIAAPAVATLFAVSVSIPLIALIVVERRGAPRRSGHSTSGRDDTSSRGPVTARASERD